MPPTTRRLSAPAGTYGFGAMTLTSRRKIKDPLYRVTNDNGKLTDDAKEVVQLVVDYGAILATGHISKQEILATVDFALGVGAKRIVITHPELAAPKLDLPTMVRARQGRLHHGVLRGQPAADVLLDLSCRACWRRSRPSRRSAPSCPATAGSPSIRARHEAIRIVIQSLHEKGLPAETFRTICIENQKRLLDLSAAPTPLE